MHLERGERNRFFALRRHWRVREVPDAGAALLRVRRALRAMGYRSAPDENHLSNVKLLRMELAAEDEHTLSIFTDFSRLGILIAIVAPTPFFIMALAAFVQHKGDPWPLLLSGIGVAALLYLYLAFIKSFGPLPRWLRRAIEPEAAAKASSLSAKPPANKAP